jgi:hypothetical protein
VKFSRKELQILISWRRICTKEVKVNEKEREREREREPGRER